MTEIKIKSNELKLVHSKIYEKVAQGWAVVIEPKKNFWGVWVATMAKIKVP